MPALSPFTRRFVQRHPRARMLPLFRYQEQAYRLGEKHPPSSGLEGYGPVWEPATCTLAAQAGTQMRINVQRDFTVLAILSSCSSNANGGFRAQFYDTLKGIRFANRGVAYGELAGSAKGNAALLLGEPYEFDVPESQILLDIRNLELVSNTIQIVFYGVALRFNQIPGSTAQ